MAPSLWFIFGLPGYSGPMYVTKHQRSSRYLKGYLKMHLMRHGGALFKSELDDDWTIQDLHSKGRLASERSWKLFCDVHLLFLVRLCLGP